MSKILKTLTMLDEKISDIHIREGENIFIRSNGTLKSTDIKVNYEEIVEFLVRIEQRLEFLYRYNIDTGEDNNVYKQKIDEYFRNGFDFSFELESIRYRVNGFMFSNGRLGMVLRKNSSTIRTFEELGLPSTLKELCKIKSGLFIISGPTGSGKTSTLSAILEYINQNLKKHIVTIEDPIEYVFENKKSIFTQREFADDFISFSDALKSVLRQDPDIIVIGEVRDEETLETAMRAAETGHLCICTMHTLGSVATIDRILDLFKSEEKDKYRAQLAMVLKVIFSQQLISIEQGKNRTVVSELLIVDKSVQNMIRENKVNQISNHIITNSKKGMLLMDNELIELYKKGIIDIVQLESSCIDSEFIRKVSSGKNVLNIMLK